MRVKLPCGWTIKTAGRINKKRTTIQWSSTQYGLLPNMEKVDSSSFLPLSIFFKELHDKTRTTKK